MRVGPGLVLDYGPPRMRQGPRTVTGPGAFWDHMALLLPLRELPACSLMDERRDRSCDFPRAGDDDLMQN